MANIVAIIVPSVVGGLCLLCLLIICLCLLFRCCWVCCGCDQHNNDYGTELQYHAVSTYEPSMETTSGGVIYGSQTYERPQTPHHKFAHYDQ